MKLVLIAVTASIALVIAATIVGAMLPRRHVASRTLRLNRTPQEIWPVYAQVTATSSVPVDIIEHKPPHRIVTRVKETEKMFGGTWTCVIAPALSGSTITITEDGWIANPLFRFISRFVIGHHATIDSVLKAIAVKLNEEPAFSGE